MKTTGGIAIPGVSTMEAGERLLRALRPVGYAASALVIDTAGAERALTKLADQVAHAQAAAARLRGSLTRRREIRRAGLEARYYVRGGLDPAYATETARDAEFRRLAERGSVDLAVAFAKGWAVHRNGHAETGQWVGTWMGHARAFVTPESRSTA